MIRHVVAWKLAAEDEEGKVAAAAAIQAALAPLPGIIPEIKSFSIGPNVAYVDTNWDICLVADYDDLDGLETYQVHPEHLAAVEIIEPLVSMRANVDFEL
ncbi:Dabb family protein [Agreia sp.]|uniref:Dabb family protein n=1 Tax=Agreia sp. TaxID=1872416 RepID=UPI0035BBBDD4